MAGDPGDSNDAQGDLLELADQALADGQFEEALELAQRALESKPRSTDGCLIAGSAILALGDGAAALEMLERGLELDRRDPDLVTVAAAARFQLGETDAAEGALRTVIRDDPDNPDAQYWLSLIVERRGSFDEVDALLQRCNELDPERYNLPTRIERTELEMTIEGVVRELPSEVREAIQDVPIVIEDLPSDALLDDAQGELAPDLLGLFVGASLKEASVFDHAPAMNTVYLFQRNLERYARTRDELIEETRVTLVHEIGHYLGLEEEELHDRDLG